jgi:hypothetical protein
MSAGLAQNELFLYENALRQGSTVLVVLADDGSQSQLVRKIMADAGAESIELTADGVALGDRARLTDSRAGPARGSIGRSARVGAGAVVS